MIRESQTLFSPVDTKQTLSMNLKRVVVTGLGALTPIGNNVQDFWENAMAGNSGARMISKFDTSAFKTQFACELIDFEKVNVLDRKESRKLDLYTQYGVNTADEALRDSGLAIEAMDPFDVGVIWGTGQGGFATFEQEMKDFALNGSIPRFNPFFMPKVLSNMAAGIISMRFGAMGISQTVATACASTNSAIMDAFNYIRLGKGKAFIVGGSDAPVTEGTVGGFNALKALSTRNDSPATASRPFDVERDGFVIGEGSGAMILEEYEHAKSRGAKIYAEVVGAAVTADAYHMTSSDPKGKGAIKAMQLALKEAGVDVSEVDYLNAHATSTPVGDFNELNGIAAVFGDSAPDLQISGTKSMTGHLLGAAGAVEAILTIKSIGEGMIPPTINTETIDPLIPKSLNLVIGAAREQSVNIAMSNSFGFGGHNAVVVFKGL